MSNVPKSPASANEKTAQGAGSDPSRESHGEGRARARPAGGVKQQPQATQKSPQAGQQSREPRREQGADPKASSKPAQGQRPRDDARRQAGAGQGPDQRGRNTPRDAQNTAGRTRGVDGEREPRAPRPPRVARIVEPNPIPPITYPEALPVSGRREEIARAIADNQVVIVCGETGSGKTTQLPKICLGLGRGITGQIGHTQPRRIAARTVAERIAEELRTPLGDVVGYKVRFTDKSGDATSVKLMTDGILLAEISTDRNLTRYDTLIIDEAHERSLNIDFILGYLRQLLPRRPDLKVIITSATIDPERFAEHFADPRTGRPAPIVEVSGRTYPVEVRYRPASDPGDQDEDRDQVTAITDAIGELERAGPGD